MAETSSYTTTGETELHRHLSFRANQPRWLLRYTFKKPSSFNLSGNMAETSSDAITSRLQHQISIPMPQLHPLPVAPPLPPKPVGLKKKPSSFFLSEEQRENYKKICVPLYNAALKGDWHAAEGILRNDPWVINMSITKREETVLHIVASTKHTHFAKNLVKKMEVEDLELQNRDGDTALCLALASTVKMVDILLKRNDGLLKIRKDGDLPFLWAVLSGNKKMAEHIYRKTNPANENWNYSDKKRILESCLAFGLLDIALNILITTRSEGFSAIDTQVLRYLACNPSAFVGTMRPGIRRLINALLPGPKLGPIVNFKAINIVKTICDIATEKQGDMLKKIAREGVLFTAARLGNYEFIMELLKLYPDITWDRDDNKHTIFHLAVMHRQENVYNLLIELGSKKLGIRDNDGNNILHLAAITPIQSRLNSVSGAALQMQRELLWFQEVKTIVSSVDITWKNKGGKTPQELFTIEHTELMDRGESWLKQTAVHCMVVAALIATIMFAVAFTLPGGNNDANGRPLFMKRSAFTVFVVTDAISLFTSSTSILMFLAILTARYQESDFLYILPLKLMVGLMTLFISIATMLIAFSASFFLLYSEGMKFVPILVTSLAVGPVILSVTLKHHLLFDVIYSTFNSRHLFRPKKRMFH